MPCESSAQSFATNAQSVIQPHWVELLPFATTAPTAAKDLQTHRFYQLANHSMIAANASLVEKI